MPTPVKSDVLLSHLDGYPPAEVAFLVSGFREGFRIPVSYDVLPRMCRNHPSATNQYEIVNTKLKRELESGRVIGPFPAPLPDLVCSPLALIPKKESGHYRLIHDLSYPKCNSVNMAIDKDYTQVIYDSIDTVIHKVKLKGRHCLMAKCDIQDAYRIVPIHPSDRHLLGFSWTNADNVKEFFMDACLAMGLSLSCQLFNRLSAALQWIVESKGLASMSHIIDDFFFCGVAVTAECSSALHSFLEMCSDIGIPIKHEKTTDPCTCLTIYGFEVDSDAMVVRLPIDKVKKIIVELQTMAKRRKVTLHALQSLIGLLNFATACIVPGRCFLRRLYNLTIGVTCPMFYIRLSKEARADLHMWLLFMESFNGKCLFLHDSWISSDSLHLHTDAASTVGFSAVLGKHWFAETWPPEFGQYHINILELFPIVLAVQIWGHKLENHKIMFHSDNEATVHVLNKTTCKDPIMMRLVRRLVLLSMKHNILFRAVHVPGKANKVADFLSRFQFQAAFQCAPQLQRVPLKLPPEMLTI
ncbi:MAG: reverse transcriptase domain-containing protein [Sedimenticola sp.]